MFIKLYFCVLGPCDQLDLLLPVNGGAERGPVALVQVDAGEAGGEGAALCQDLCHCQHCLQL